MLTGDLNGKHDGNTVSISESESIRDVVDTLHECSTSYSPSIFGRPNVAMILFDEIDHVCTTNSIGTSSFPNVSGSPRRMMMIYSSCEIRFNDVLSGCFC